MGKDEGVIERSEHNGFFFLPVQDGRIGLQLDSRESNPRIYVPCDGSRYLRFEPLGLKELIQGQGQNGACLEVTATNAAELTVIDGHNIEEPVDASITLSYWRANARLFSLIPGGWLPSPWAQTDVALLDRNVVIGLPAAGSVAQATGGRIELDGSPASLASLLDVGAEMVSPLPFVMEGCRGGSQTRTDLERELGRAISKLNVHVHHEKIEAFSFEEMVEIQNWLFELQPAWERATNLLVEAAPLVSRFRVRMRDRLDLLDQVLSIADKHQVTRDQLVVPALVSCIFSRESKDSHAPLALGRKVLKPVGHYGRKDAYNAIFDLFLLGLLASANELFPGKTYSLYTKDVGLAAFWTALQPFETAHWKLTGPGRARFMFRCSLNEHLFPEIDSEHERALLKVKLGLV